MRSFGNEPPSSIYTHSYEGTAEALHAFPVLQSKFEGNCPAVKVMTGTDMTSEIILKNTLFRFEELSGQKETQNA